VALPFQISTLLYGFNAREEVLLLERAREPNQGLWSPCGGKLKTEIGESPYACACREAHEELGLELEPTDLHLTGLVSGGEVEDYEFNFTPTAVRLSKLETRTSENGMPWPILLGVGLMGFVGCVLLWRRLTTKY